MLHVHEESAHGIGALVLKDEILHAGEVSVGYGERIGDGALVSSAGRPVDAEGGESDEVVLAESP